MTATKANPELAKERNFLDIPAMTAEERLHGSPEKFEKAGFERSAIDALVSMIAVYDAERMPELQLTLGDLVALYGKPKLAYPAYRPAMELGHPRSDEVKAWASHISAHYARSQPKRRQPGHPRW